MKKYIRLLSFIVPVYNSANYLERCYQSIIEIKNINFEILFINDGSTDNSMDILEEIRVKDNRVKVLSQENKGAAAARNFGIRASNGKYLFFLDADDGLNAEALATILTLAENEKTDILGFIGEVVAKGGQVVAQTYRHPITYNKVIDGKSVLISGFQPSSACFFLYKTEFIKSNNLFFIEGTNEEDVELTARMFIPAERVLFTETVAYRYYKNEDSVTNTKDKDRVKHYLKSVIIVAEAIMANKTKTQDKMLLTAIEKNANSVVWNLLWRLYKQKEVDKEFRLQCVQELRDKNLYPINGALKTRFQRITRVLFNQRILLQWLLK